MNRSLVRPTPGFSLSFHCILDFPFTKSKHVHTAAATLHDNKNTAASFLAESIMSSCHSGRAATP